MDNPRENDTPATLFDHLSLFEDLTPEQRELIQPLFIPCSEGLGTVIFEQGEAARYLYLVVEGEVFIRFKPDDGPPIQVARVPPGGVVGWSAALGSPGYTSSAICADDTRMLRVSGEALRRLCENHPEIGALVLDRLATLIADRLRTAHIQVMTLLEHGLGSSLKSL